MTPNDLDVYLGVFARHQVASAALKLPDGTELHFVSTPALPPQLGTDPTPGGWKGSTLDDPSSLRGDDEYKGSLP
jgi:hypothetical protein